MVFLHVFLHGKVTEDFGLQASTGFESLGSKQQKRVNDSPGVGIRVSFDLKDEDAIISYHSMTVTRHKGEYVFVQRWKVPSTLKDATCRYIPLQIVEK